MKRKGIHSTAYVFPDCVIGQNCRIGPHAVIGSLGLAVKEGDDGSFKRVETKGTVILEDNVDIGALTVIHRGVEGDTVIGQGSFIGPFCNIGHDTKIGRNCLIINGTVVCGHVTIGDHTRINPSSVIRNRVKIGRDVVVGIGSLVLDDVPNGVTVVGRPAVSIERFREERKVLKEVLTGRKCDICGKQRRAGIPLHDKWICVRCAVACSTIVKCGETETCEI